MFVLNFKFHLQANFANQSNNVLRSCSDSAISIMSLGNKSACNAYFCLTNRPFHSLQKKTKQDKDHSLIWRHIPNRTIQFQILQTRPNKKDYGTNDSSFPGYYFAAVYKIARPATLCKKLLINLWRQYLWGEWRCWKYQRQQPHRHNKMSAQGHLWSQWSTTKPSHHWTGCS